jgi:aminoglycoside phosphotransferase (APT) family kinase protein
LRIVVTGWLEGRTGEELLNGGQARRAGELAGRWIRHAARLCLSHGPIFDEDRLRGDVGKWTARLSQVDPSLGLSAAEVRQLLTMSMPRRRKTLLVHGSFYARHVLDLGQSAGVIDWDGVGQGELELDAAMFLATVWRQALSLNGGSNLAREAEDAFRRETRGLLREPVLRWHRAAALLHLAHRGCKPGARRTGWRRRALAMLVQAREQAMSL